MTKGFKIHRKLTEIVAELKRLQNHRTRGNELYEQLLLREADKLQREYRYYHGFNYNPLMYEDVKGGDRP